jgi:predicted secreted hydrolase
VISADRPLRALGALLLALGASAAPAAEEPAWEPVLPGLELAYPRDHGAHAAHQTEWWYLTGNLEDAAGRRFGYQFTIFRRGLTPQPLEADASPLRARALYAGHLAVTDAGAGRTRFAERLRRGAAPFARASHEDLDLVLEDWSLARRDDDTLLLRAADPGAGIALELELTPRKPLVLHGEGGWSRKGEAPGNASAYASWTRLATRGTLRLDDEALAVTGGSWFDHEFGSSVLEEGTLGWDWFGLQLDDGRELMAFHLRRVGGDLASASAGTLVEPDGTVRHLGHADFAIEALERWTSPRTGASYPSAWRLSVPAHGIDLRATPLVADCELVTGGSTGIVYWEGPVELSGTSGGRGYAELTGYSGSMAGRF